MATSPDITSMALFCDFENVALGVRETHHEKFDIKLVLERLLLKGSIVVKKAYCDWERYKGFKATMHEASFELIEIPHVRQSGKNSADIRLVVDALDLCYTKAHVNTFVIISGDSDFSPLVSKLRENNKQVIGVGVKQSTSDLLTANCDEFIFYDDLVRESGRQSMRRDARPPAAPAATRKPPASSGNVEDDRKRDETENRRTKAVDLAVQTFEALYAERGDGGKIWASVLKEAIKRRRPDFSESYFGFRSFGGLLEEAQARGFLEMGRDEKSNAFVFRSSGGNAPVAAAAEPASAPAPAAPEVLPVVHRAGESEPRERGRGRSRGGRGRGAPDRHDFEAPLAIPRGAPAPTRAAEPAPELDHELVDAQEDDFEDEDDAAERFADVARAAQASRDADEPVLGTDASAPDADTYETDPDAVEAPAAREPNPRRGNRGGRGRGNGQASGQGNAARNDGNRRNERPPVVAAPEPAPVPAPAPTPEPAVTAVAEATPAAKTPRARSSARKTAAPVVEAPAAETAPAAKTARKTAAKTAAKPAAKTPAKRAPRKTGGSSDAS